VKITIENKYGNTHRIRNIIIIKDICKEVPIGPSIIFVVKNNIKINKISVAPAIKTIIIGNNREIIIETRVKTKTKTRVKVRIKVTAIIGNQMNKIIIIIGEIEVMRPRTVIRIKIYLATRHNMRTTRAVRAILEMEIEIEINMNIFLPNMRMGILSIQLKEIGTEITAITDIIIIIVILVIIIIVTLIMVIIVIIIVIVIIRHIITRIEK
jgi:hypothetical protein